MKSLERMLMLQLQMTTSLKSAYDICAINKEDRKFLQIKIENTFYQFKGWPTGVDKVPLPTHICAGNN